MSACLPLFMVYLLAISGSISIIPLTIPLSFIKKQRATMALCKPDEIVRGMMDGDMFVNCLHSTLTSSVYPETGLITQRLYNICQTIFIQILMQDEI